MKTLVFQGIIKKIAMIKILSKFSKKAYHAKCSPIQYLKLPDPKLPAENWVRVKNIQTGICGSDMTFYTCGQSASVAFYPIPGSETTYLGHETIGTISEVGKKVKKFKIGDRVTLWKYLSCCDIKGIADQCEMCKKGMYADCENYGAEPIIKTTNGAGFGDMYIAPESQLLKVDNEITNDQAVLVEPFSVSLHAVLKHIPKPKDKVLVIGAGMIGLNVIQFVKLYQPKCKIYVLEKNKNKYDFARKLGADEFLSGDTYEAVAEATSGKLYVRGKNKMIMGGFDIIYDCVGKGTFFNDTLRWLKAQGTLVKIGYQMTPTTFDETPIWWQGLNIIGSDSHGMEEVNGEKITSFELVMRLMKEKKITTKGFITHRFKLDNYKEAFKLLIENPRDTVKVVLECE